MRLTSLLNISGTQRRLSTYRYYDLLVHVFVVILLISNIVAPKICAFGRWRISGAELLFPITYIFGDIFTEVYGYAGSRRAIWLGFFSSALLAGMGIIVVHMPAAPDVNNLRMQEALSAVLNYVPRVLAASLIAFWGGEFVNSYVMAKMKLLTNGRWLWTRTVGSTVAGQAVDTVVGLEVDHAVENGGHGGVGRGGCDVDVLEESGSEEQPVFQPFQPKPRLSVPSS